MKVLIIGHRSMVGKRLAQHLAGRYEIRTCGRDKEADLFWDLTEEDLPEPSFDSVDVIINCAASFLPDSPEGLYVNESINALAPLKIAQLASQLQCSHLIHLSTISSYDHPQNGYYNSYGISKKHGQENIAFACGHYNTPLTILILSQLYDEFGEARKHQPLLYHLLDTARKGETATLYGSKNPERNFLFVEDVCQLIERVIEKKVTGSYPCVSPETYHLKEIAQMAFEVFGTPEHIKFDSDKPDIPSVYIPQDFNLYEKLDFTPEVSLRSGFERYKQACTVSSS